MDSENKFVQFWNSYQTIIKIVIAIVLAVCFIGNIVFVIFSGDEFKSLSEAQQVKGFIRFTSSDYLDSYFAGEKFTFDKKNTQILLVAKDPEVEEIVKNENLPADEYGFKINGEGNIYDNASDITINTDITSIDVVSKKYPSLKINIPITVLAEIDSSKLTNNLLCEAENANLYKDNVLLSYEEKTTLPDANKPYISSFGTTVDGASCSGGACLRNFKKSNMKIEFKVYAKQETSVTLQVLICKRKETKTFGEYYKFLFNGASVSEVSSQTIPIGTGYFEPYSLTAVTLTLKKGLNTFTFECGETLGMINPVNFDGIRLVATEAVLGGADLISTTQNG